MILCIIIILIILGTIKICYKIFFNRPLKFNIFLSASHKIYGYGKLNGTTYVLLDEIKSVRLKLCNPRIDSLQWVRFFYTLSYMVVFKSAFIKRNCRLNFKSKFLILRSVCVENIGLLKQTNIFYEYIKFTYSILYIDSLFDTINIYNARLITKYNLDLGYLIDF